MDTTLNLLISLLIVLCIVFLLWVERRYFSFLPKSKISRVSKYRVRPTIMNRSEYQFYLELKRQLPANLHLFSKMRLIDILEPYDASYGSRNKIWIKHIDFLICDRYLKPVMAIELNGASHRAQARIDRDRFVSAIFEQAGLPLIFVSVGTDFEYEVQKILNNLLLKNVPQNTQNEPNSAVK